MNAPRHLSTLCVLSMLLFARAAAAGDKEEAKALFDRGVASMEAGRYAEGCPDIAESYRLDPQPGALFTLAECEAKRGRIATAAARYDEYLALYETLPRGKKLKQGNRRKESLAQKAALLPQIPELTLILPPDAPSGTLVKLDGSALDPSALGSPRAVDPGEHVAVTQPPGGPTTEVRVTMNKAEKHTVNLRVEAAPPAIPPRPVAIPRPPAPPPSPPPPDAGPSGRRVGAYLAGGAGIAGVIVGSVTADLALVQSRVVALNCKDTSGGLALCNSAGAEAAERAKTLEIASIVGFGAAVAGLSAAVILFVTEPSRPKAAPLRSAAARPAGPRWISAGVLSAGAGDTIFGLQGAW